MAQGRRTKEIKCSPAITPQDINNCIHVCPKGCDNCRHMMQMARKIVTETSLSCRKNLKITCRGDHVTYYFLSGSGGNQLAVETDRGKLVVRTIRRTWREAIKDVFKNNWKTFLGVFVYIAGTAMQRAANVPFLPLAGKAVQGIGKMIM